MPEVFLCADFHLGEERLAIMQRPFKDADEQFRVLLKNHNRFVQPDDLVLFLGDVCNKDHPEELPFIDEFHGRKWLFRGNHDRGISDDEFGKHFERIFQEGEIVLTEFEGIPCSLNHYPSLATSTALHLTGHIHSAWKFQLNAINVGVDVHHFRPVNIKQIPFFLNAISNYYDEDVFVAYSDAQMSHRGKRGKPGNYFNSPTRIVEEEIQ